jgi:D-3-phosphoglycerate dehydrogenase / 2-oxoglutarate reductase
MPRILVTPRSYGKFDPQIRKYLEDNASEVIYNSHGRPLSAAELLELVKNIDGYIAGLDEINAQVLQAARQLKVIARYGVGVDRVDLEAATQHGIVVTNTPGANSASVAELTIGLMLSLARSIPFADQATKRGDWPRIRGLGLRGKTVGLVGFGAIGRAVAARLAGFGLRLLVNDPFLQPELAAGFKVELVPLASLLNQAGIVSLHLPASPDTIGMVNADFLGQMKAGAFLINTARGELVDEAALREAIESGHLAGVGLDCFSQEPPDPEHPLLAFENIILTPHSGSHTDEAIDQMGWMATRACLGVLRGERVEHVVNPEVFDK